MSERKATDKLKISKICLHRIKVESPEIKSHICKVAPNYSGKQKERPKKIAGNY